jgi:protease IV
MKDKKNRWWQSIKVIAALTIFSFFLSIILSAFIGNGLDNFDGNVAVIEVTGTILAEEGNNFLFEDITSSDNLRRLIRKAERNDNIEAIVFKINSPGGSAVASEEIANAIKQANKTTVAWIREIGTSGAYWIASSTDHIIANRMSITGSIGVIASYLGFSGFLNDHNVTYERLVSGNLKDIGSPFKEMTAQERILFQKSLDSIHDYFVDEIAENRNLKKRDVEKIATGQFYLGVQAKDIGLVDELGGREEVIAYVEKKIGKDADFVSYKTDRGFLSSLGKIFNENSFFIGKGIGNSLFTKAKLKDSVSIST